MKLYRVLISVAIMLGSRAAYAQADMRAGDAMQLFSSFCIQTDGDRSRALAVLGEGNALAKKLPDALVTTLQAGRVGGVAWAIASPNSAQLLLEYTSDGICGVRIADADEKSVQDAFATMIEQNSVGQKVTTSEPVITKEAGAQRTYHTYNFAVGGKKTLFAISTMDHRVGPQQHLLTFGHLAP